MSSEHDVDDNEEEILAPDETPTPMWLPVLGAALFLLAVLWLVVTQQQEDPAAGPAGDDAAETGQGAEADQPAEGDEGAKAAE